MPATKNITWKWLGDAEVYLEQIFKSGEINDSDRPGEVHKQYMPFQEYSIDVFCKNFNKTKLEYGKAKPATVTPRKIGRRTQSTKKGNILIIIVIQNYI